MLRSTFRGIKRIVIKVGSTTLTHQTGKLNLEQLEKLVRQLADLHNQGLEIVLVTSGAGGAGLGKLGLAEKPKTLPEKQAVAAIGQGLLMQMYEKFFGEYGQVVGQILLTREDFSDRRRFLNARNTLHAIFRYGAIPIINENDTVAVDEIKLGDNDTLSAMVAGLVDAELLILLSDIDGLYTGNPRVDKKATLIDVVTEITPEIEALAGGAGSRFGTGGMETKIQAAKIAGSSGVAMVIAHGAEDNVIRRIMHGEPLGTLFLPRENRVETRKKWIAYGSAVQGKIYVDKGAARVLVKDGKSLLPIGITGVEGTFELGHTVSIITPDGQEIARGIVNYPARELDIIKGAQTRDISKLLGYKDYDEVIHRDNMVLSIWEGENYGSGRSCQQS